MSTTKRYTQNFNNSDRFRTVKAQILSITKPYKVHIEFETTVIDSKTIKIPIQKAKAKSDTDGNSTHGGLDEFFTVSLGADRKRDSASREPSRRRRRSSTLSERLLSDPLRRRRIEIRAGHGFFGELRNPIRLEKENIGCLVCCFLNNFSVGRWWVRKTSVCMCGVLKSEENKQDTVFLGVSADE